MNQSAQATIQAIAFAGTQRVARGALTEVALAVKSWLQRDAQASMLVFDASTSQVIDLDLRGSADDVVQRLTVPVVALSKEPAEATAAEEQTARGRGRPKLGVVAREVTLLPRHWQWLAEQPGGASTTLRKLVERARLAAVDRDALRQAQESAYRFMAAMAGDLPGFEQASRLLFANDRRGFAEQVAGWPEDLRDHLLALAQRAFTPAGASA
jgi:uncharacterized protein